MSCSLPYIFLKEPHTDPYRFEQRQIAFPGNITAAALHTPTRREALLEKEKSRVGKTQNNISIDQGAASLFPLIPAATMTAGGYLMLFENLAHTQNFTGIHLL